MTGGADGTTLHPWPDGSTFAHYAGPMLPPPRSEFEEMLINLGLVTLGGLAVVVAFLILGLLVSLANQTKEV